MSVDREHLLLFNKFLISYFTELQCAYKEMDVSLLQNNDVSRTLNQSLYNFLCLHIIDFDKALKLTLQPQVNNGDSIISVNAIPKRSIKSSMYKYISSKGDDTLIIKIYRTFNYIKRYFAKKTSNNSATVNTTDNSPNFFQFIDLLRSFENHDIERLSENIVDLNAALIASVIADIEGFNNHASDRKKCILVTTLFTPTWAPTFKSLEANGWSICNVLHNDLKNYTGYGALTSDEIDRGSYTCFHGFIGASMFAINASATTPVLFSGESYHGVNMFADAGVFMSLNLSCITRTIRHLRPSGNKNLFLLMYDGLKPVFKNCLLVNQDSSKYYARFMRTADKIIYNSNDDIFGDYVENAFGIHAPRLHFKRFSSRPNKSKPKISMSGKKDELHVVSISVIFDPQNCNARATTQDMVRSILEQGMHFHCYTGEEKADKDMVDQFIQSVKPEFRNNFHLHDVIRDQVTLVNELQQYDVGINGTDHLLFAKGIYDLKDRQYSDGLMMYLQSTFATSFFVYAAAGLPILIPRCMTKATDYFGKFAIPVCLSEFASIKNILIKANLPDLHADVATLQKLAVIDEHVADLIDFLSPINSSVVLQDEVSVTKESVAS